MSITSKARRDARIRRLAKLRNVPAPGVAPPIEPHAELRSEDGQLLGGIVRREGEWTLGIGGRIVGGSESAARVLAMLKRAAVLHEREGESIRLSCSSALSAAAQQEVREQGLSFAQYEERLAEEMASGRGPALSPPDASENLH
jgi:hypothetical protein